MYDTETLEEVQSVNSDKGRVKDMAYLKVDGTYWLVHSHHKGGKRTLIQTDSQRNDLDPISIYRPTIKCLQESLVVVTKREQLTVIPVGQQEGVDYKADTDLNQLENVFEAGAKVIAVT